MKKRIILILSLTVLTAAGSFFYWKQVTPQALALREVNKASVVRQNFQVITKGYGIIEPKTRIDVTPPLAGRMESVNVEEGQIVQKGDVLGWISSTERAVLMASAAVSSKDKGWSEIYKPIPILAPISGTVIANAVKSGQTFHAQQALFALSDRLILRAQVDEIDIVAIRVKQRVEFNLDAMPEQKFSGVISRVSYDVTKIGNLTKYTVEIEPDSVTASMRTGMTAMVSFETQLKENVLVVPRAAVFSDGGEWYVEKWQHEKDKVSPVRQRIVLGERSEQKLVVKEGLLEGDLITLKSGSATL